MDSPCDGRKDSCATTGKHYNSVPEIFLPILLSNLFSSDNL